MSRVIVRRAVRRAGLLAAACCLATACMAQPLKIRAGWVAAPASLVPFLFAKRENGRHLGVSYTLDPVYFSSSPAEIGALATGDIDIAALGFSTVSLAILNAGISDIRIVADEIQDGVPGYHSNTFSVLKDSPVRTIEDLKGRIVATNGYGSGVDIAMRTVLLKHGLRDKVDYTTVETPFPSMKAMLIERKADLVTTTLPFAFDPAVIAAARPLFEQKDAFGPSELSFWTMRAGYIQANRPALVDFLEDALRAVRWYLNPANRDEAVAIVATFTRQPPEPMKSWLFTRKDYYRDPNGLPDLAALAKNIRAQKELGFISADIDPTHYADLSLIKEAGARLDKTD
jgi:sulfonate transport system substrate-binding protein